VKFRAVPFVLVAAAAGVASALASPAPALRLGPLALAALAGDTIPPLAPRPPARPTVRPGERQAPDGRVVRPPTPGDTIPGARRDSAAAGDTARAPVPEDTLVDRLLELEGYVPVEYKADSAEFAGDTRTLRLRGNPEVTREGQSIASRDSIVYRERSDFVTAYGEPRASGGEGDPITGDVMFYDLAGRRGTVRGARTKITQNATWFVEGDVTEERGQRIYATGSTFTSDDRAEPAYHFRADRIMIVRDRVLVGRPAYLYFKNVPVFALPFIVQDLESGRRSGFLIPQFEINDIIRNSGSGNSRGTGREISNIGYYWAVNQYMGVELAGRWRSGSYTALRGDLDFNWRRRFLTGSLAFENFWEQDGPSRLNLNGNAGWKLNERTQASLALDYARSSRFERDRTLDPQRQTQDISSSLSFSRRLDWGNFSFGAERRQSLANDDVTFSPRFDLDINPITLFPSNGGTASFYNDAVLNLRLNGNRTTRTPGDGLARREPGTQQSSVATSAGITFGGLGLSTSATYSQNGSDFLPEIDSAFAEPGLPADRLRPRTGFSTERVEVSASTSYQFNLIGSSYIAPSIGFSQEYVRVDSLTGGRAPADSTRGAFGSFIGGPPRLNVGASLNTDIYGFFGGFGPYSAVRHHLQPNLSWRYSPQSLERDTARARIQRQVFGQQVGRTTNQVTLTLNQTFEAKLRDRPDPVPAGPRPDSLRQQGDSATAGEGISGGNAAAPADPRKVTLLSINTTTPLVYSFEDLDSLGTRFPLDDLSNTVSSDLLGGVQFTVSHDLFEDEIDSRGRLTKGGFSPFLTSFNTSLTLGANSALFRWLGFSRATEQERAPERGQTADSTGQRPLSPPGGATFTGNNQMVGGGPWSLSLNYSLQRNRRSARDTVPGFFNPGNQQVSGQLTFSPTRNWAATWSTAYSFTEREFFTHTIGLKRDLYRWQANFDYIVAPNGNTSFAFSVHLIDLPDLKSDYNEQNLGTDRPQETDNARRLPR
jgi:LptD protein